jgi:hypothetical protein
VKLVVQQLIVKEVHVVKENVKIKLEIGLEFTIVLIKLNVDGEKKDGLEVVQVVVNAVAEDVMDIKLVIGKMLKVTVLALVIQMENLVEEQQSKNILVITKQEKIGNVILQEIGVAQVP